jgi:hypothetical protein
MVASIPEFGFKIPVLARSSGEIVDGHLRTKAAIKMGMPEVPVILCDDWMDLLRTVFIEDVGNAPLPVQQISIGDESLSRQEQGRDGLLIGIPAREIVRRLQWIRTDLDEFSDLEIDLLTRTWIHGCVQSIDGKVSPQLEKSQRRRLGFSIQRIEHFLSPGS